MKLITLAAGKGERLMPLTTNTPKPLLSMGTGRTLLEEQLKYIEESAVVDEVVLVVGYLGDQIEAKLATYTTQRITVRALFNPFYDVSNNLLSLWLAKEAMNTDFLVMNGDNLFSPTVFRAFVQDTGDGIFVSMNVKTSYDQDDMKIALKDGAVARVSKLIPEKEADGESPGLVLVRGEKARKVFREHLEVLGKDTNFRNSFWLEVFNHMYDHGVTITPWQFDAEGTWQEVDFHMDLEKAKNLLRLLLRKEGQDV